MDLSQPSSTSIIMMPNQTIGVGVTAPSSSETHSYYLNTTTGDIYQKQNDGTYTIVDNLTGPPGKDGTTPTNEQLTALIQPLIPTAIPGTAGRGVTSIVVNPDYTVTFTYSDGTSYKSSSIRGAPGSDGSSGRGVSSIVLNADYTLTFTFTDQTSYTSTSIRGATGATGTTSWKDIKSRLTTNASGVWTKTYAANFWAAEPSVNVCPISCTGTGQLGYKVTKTSANNQWTITVTFTAIASSVTAVALGANLNLTTSTGTVTFDYQASEVV